MTPMRTACVCHLCGGWYRALAPGHLRRQDLTADEYRQIAGLKPGHALAVASLSALRAAQLRERIARDQRIREGMRVGMQLARSGQLQARRGRWRRLARRASNASATSPPPVGGSEPRAPRRFAGVAGNVPAAWPLSRLRATSSSSI